MNLKNQIQKTILLISAILLTSGLSAQENEVSGLKEFHIVIEKSDTGISMVSKKGCAWKELTFGLEENKAMGIDEFGMTEEKDGNAYSDPQFADFLFTIELTKKGVKLKSTKGTAWTKLAFKLPKKKKQAIDQMGMRNSNK